MSKRLILILAFAFVVGISLNAFAEVQNVKVSGDITAIGIYRSNLDLAKSPASGASIDGMVMTNANQFDDRAELLASITRLRVDADLTDNVIATVRLLNEREWNGDNGSAGVSNNNIGVNNNFSPANDIDGTAVGIDLAFVTLKEFLYSPLTLRVGRQEARFQNGFIVGDPDTNVVSTLAGTSAGDLSAHKAFDAIRATLDYNPLTVDLLYAKAVEGVSTRNDDITLAGVNASYQLDKATTLEGFFWSKTRGTESGAVLNVDSGNTTSFTNTLANRFPNDRTDKVHTVGVRAVNTSINNLTIDALGAFQFGTYNPKFDVNARWTGVGNKAQTARRYAFAAEVAAIYNLKDIEAIAKYHPMIMGAFVYLSGENRDKTDDKKFRGWDANFEDQTFGHLTNAMMGFSNIKLGGVSLTGKPTEDTALKLDYVAAWFDKKFSDGRLVNLSGVSGARSFRMGDDSFAGQEVDLTLSYDYTEDVQFSILGGIFFPGAINDGSGSNMGLNYPRKAKATELLGSMKVTF